MREAALSLPLIDKDIQMFIADNSPEEHGVPPGFQGTYLHDGTNPGLARRYNQALQAAEACGAEWLLTLDQDTTLTVPYLNELLTLSKELAGNPKIAVILPKLIALGKLYSPHTSCYRSSRVSIDRSTSGVLNDAIFGFNSAALVRVSSLRAIGGYDEHYWLDYLDHATFATLQRRKLQIFVMNSVLTHELAQAHGPVSAARSENIRRAEQRFYAEHSHGREWMGRKLDILRQVIGHARRGRFGIAAEHFRFLVNRLP